MEIKDKVYGDEKPEPIGYCSSCEFKDSDGDYGEIPSCSADEDAFPEGYELGDGSGDTRQCPAWKPNAPLVWCKKHRHWHYSTWELSCPDCYKDWEQSQDK